jgi:hypothetical protein
VKKYLEHTKRKEKVGAIIERERQMFDLQLKLEIARSERQHLIYSGIAENDVIIFLYNFLFFFIFILLGFNKKRRRNRNREATI